QKGLQIGELVGVAQRRDVRVRESDAVASGELEHEFGLERTFDVKMQFCLGQAAHEVFEADLSLRGGGGCGHGLHGRYCSRWAAAPTSPGYALRMTCMGMAAR